MIFNTLVKIFLPAADFLMLYIPYFHSGFSSTHRKQLPLTQQLFISYCISMYAFNYCFQSHINHLNFMTKIYTKIFTGLLILLANAGAYAQVTVINPANTTPGLAATYADLAAAITDLNIQTDITGPVVITLDAANPQTAPAGGYVINASLPGASAINTVTINGSNNLITAPTNHTVGALTDAFFKIIGSDFIILQNFNMQENAANTITTAASNNMTEFGVALFYLTTTNGAQNCTIQNNSITLNKIYQNTFGIYSNSGHSATNVSAGVPATTATGGNSGLKIYGNTISNVNNGIVVMGTNGAAADFNTGIDIGGTSAATGNTISNYGTITPFSSYFLVSGTLFGVLVRNSTAVNVSNNTITSSNGGNSTGTLRGIYMPGFSFTPTGTFTNEFNNNNISITTGVINGAAQGITIEASAGNATSTTNINGNNFTAVGYSANPATGVASVIFSQAPSFTTSISNNTFTNMSSTSTNSFTFISNPITVPVGGSQTISNNAIVTGFTKTGAGGTVTGISSTGASSGNVTQNWNNNNFSNISVTGATILTFMNNTDGGSVNHNFIGNTFSNITGGTGAVNGIVSNFGGQNAGTGNLISGNTISNISGGGIITGIAIGSSATASSTVTGNTIFGLRGTGSASIIGIISGAPIRNNISKNTIYNLETTNVTGAVSGITVTGGALHNIVNNRIGDLRAPLANTSNPVIGISLIGGTTVNVYYNTVHLNATSAGALFGSSAISTSTTASLTLNNNIFVNNSTPAGAGLVVAYRRTNTTLSTYTNSSDRNLFYAGTPSASNLIHYDGTNAFETLAAYKAMTVPATLDPRDANSISENPNFVSTTGGSADFLKINTTLPTGIESGGINIAGITDDFEGQIRQGNTGYVGAGTAPDLGADEFEFGSVVPITVEFFRGAKQQKANLLDWKISCTSTDYATLAVERSTDGRNFTTINTQRATALRCQSPFSYTDATANAGVNYYRIKMTDQDGRITYSPLVVITGKAKAFETVSLYPNPVQVNTTLKIAAANAGNMQMVITDMSGRLMQKQTVRLQSGSNLISLKLGSLATGSYQVTLIDEAGEKTSIRFVKQ